MAESFDLRARTFTRIERRAKSAYDRELLLRLRELAVVESACRTISIGPDGLGWAQLSFTPGTLTLVGIAGVARDWLATLEGEVRIVDAGRYSGRWWITVSNGHTSAVVLGLRAHLSAHAGGVGVAELVA
jgi:hypothetical protein